MQARCLACRAAPQLADACRSLGLQLPVRDAAEARQAYLSKIREVHPDLHTLRDTTAEAADVTVAYQVILEVRTVTLGPVRHDSQSGA